MTFAKLIFPLVGTLMLGFAQLANAQDWQLVDADQITSDSFLILTVPLDDPADLAVIAQGIEAQFGVPFTAEWPLRAISVHCLIFDTSGHPNIDALIAGMRADARIRTVQRMQDFQTYEQRYADPLFPLQWSLDHMNVSKAHLLSTGAGIRVGVVDSAIDSTHQDLMGQVFETHDFVAVSPPNIPEAHGTAVAGIIAADATNATGMVGVAPGATLIGLRACWEAPGRSGQCNSFSLARALNFAILNRVDVLNLSIGGPFDPLIEELVLAAIQNGMIIVAASGETDQMSFPASIDGVIAAGGIATGRIPAPMVDVISTATENRHRYVSGSSISAAHVSGVVALLLAHQADLTFEETMQALRAAITLKGEVPMLDACKAIHAVVDSAALCIP
ncbi:S8 family peptidase [Parasulfitobacter algicola]|uniref:S8 family serine peptidase n=1 Tax=Parasulfitobacter algicola TaxID=2614809 RepID=A0ABX2IMB7_9RHOB|nr:S8 family serine peptidase [Sulfitobacter algicola]NSX53670.1 S8 family serine peptidase [Sulfitobacter algicola]